MFGGSHFCYTRRCEGVGLDSDSVLLRREYPLPARWGSTGTESMQDVNDEIGEKRALYESIASPQRHDQVADRITEAGKAYNIKFSFRGTTGPSQASHLLIAYTLSVLGNAAQSDMVEAIFRGHFEEGRDITDEGFLLEVGRRVGLTDDEIMRVVRGDDGLGARIAGTPGAVEEEVRRAMAMGVRAVPCVTVAGRFMVGGFQDQRVFEDVFDKARREKRDSK